jgi:2-oxoglutarate ferredoxin oxidoreductase subunit alpha
MKYNLLIGGSAGEGMDTISSLLEKILKRSGYSIFSTRDYMSRIQGGHNFIQIRFGTEPIDSHNEELDLIFAMDLNTILFHREQLKGGGKIICDETMQWDDPQIMRFPIKQIAQEIDNPNVFSTIGVGIILKMFGISDAEGEEVVTQKFKEDICDDHKNALKKGYGLTQKCFGLEAGESDNNILINGNQAIALGALAGGIGFYAACPRTSSGGIMTYLLQKQKETGIVIEQAEDGMAAINMAVGASYAGVRTMTGTSSQGLSAMAEAIGLASMMETPLVVVDVQQPGPAAGLPTRTEQGDLSFALMVSHGEFPKMVLAVRNLQDAFYQTVRALNIADEYQIPVVILSDQYLADTVQTIPPYDFRELTMDRYIAKEEDIEDEKYSRYKLMNSGISPRVIPGKIEGVTVLAGSNEHNEYGHITESAGVRSAMMKKRMEKMELLKEQVIEPEYLVEEKPEVLLLGWGSMEGPLKETVQMLQAEGVAVGCLVFGDLWPLPIKSLKKYSEMAEKIVNVEQNYTGQLAKLIQQETNIVCTHHILKYDGRQSSGREIYKQVKGEVL